MDWTGKTILIAEDDESACVYLEAILKKTGATLIFARNGEEAVSLVELDPSVDLILMDLQMPGSDGFEALEKIRRMRPGIPQIAQTAYAMVEDEIIALEAGFDAYISKPINKNDLIEMIAKFLGKSD